MQQKSFTNCLPWHSIGTFLGREIVELLFFTPEKVSMPFDVASKPLTGSAERYIEGDTLATEITVSRKIVLWRG